MYDTNQLKGFYGLPCLPPNCSTDQMKEFVHFHEEFVRQLEPVLSGFSSSGFFLDSCLAHCQSLSDDRWAKFSALKHPMRETFADWYNDVPGNDNATRVRDCDYPCNQSCH